MKKTTNYQLNQWEMTDRIQMADFNHDNEKIDAALHGLAGQVAEKADTSTVNSLTAQVGKKAELTALAAEETARKSADTVLQSGIAELAPRAGAQFLKAVTAAETGSSFDIPLDGIDWGQWRSIHILLEVLATDDSSLQILAGINKIAYISGNTSDTDQAKRSIGHLILYPMFDIRMKADLISMHEGKLYHTGYRFCDLDQITLKASSPTQILSGTEIRIWGAK